MFGLSFTGLGKTTMMPHKDHRSHHVQTDRLSIVRRDRITKSAWSLFKYKTHIGEYLNQTDKECETRTTSEENPIAWLLVLPFHEDYPVREEISSGHVQ